MTTTAVPTIEALIEGFPQKPNKIQGLPTYEKLNALKKDLCINASSVPSTLGGGENGYLGALLSDQAYEAITAPLVVPFVAPAYPGNLPGALAGTASQISDQLRAFNENLRIWKEYDNVTKALRKQLIDAVKYAYISPLEHELSGFNNVTIQTILDHLFANYDKISPNDLAANETKMNEPWDGAEPFETVIMRIKHCCDFAKAAGQPFTNEQILTKTYAIVFNTGLYFDACKEWDRTPAANKTIANFQIHIMKAQNLLRHQQNTSKHHGFAASAIHELTENLANYIVNDRTEKTTDRQAIQTITNQNAALMKELADMRNMFEQYKTGNATKPPTTTRKKTTQRDHGGYCWSHGYLVAPEHTSITCRNKKPGHVDTATRTDTQNGSQRGKPTA